MELAISDAMLVQGGAVVAIAALAIGAVSFIMLGIKGHLLKKRFDQEYGKLKK